MSSTSIGIIGGGVIGLLTAWELVRVGVSTVVVESTTSGTQSSWAGGGILSPLYPWRYPEAVNELCRWSQHQYPILARELSAITAVDVEWERSGMIVLHDDHADAVAWLRRYGERGDPIGETELRELEPNIRASANLALWLPDIAQIRNPRLLRALRIYLEKAGVRFYDHAPVDGFVTDGCGVYGIETARGTVEVAQCVVAAGAWSNRFIEHSAVRLGHRPVKGQMLMLRTVPNTVRHIILCGQHYLIPRRDGCVLVGSTVEDCGFDYTVTQTARAALYAFAGKIIPTLRKAEIVGHWAGLRPGSDTGVPRIGEIPYIGGLYVNTGHFRNGIVMAPGSARLLADLMLSRPPIVDPAPYALP